MAHRKGTCSRISIYLTRKSRTLECKRQKPKLAGAKRQTYLKAHIPIWGESRNATGPQRQLGPGTRNPPAFSLSSTSPSEAAWSLPRWRCRCQEILNSSSTQFNHQGEISSLSPVPVANAQGMIWLLLQGAYTHPWILGAFLKRGDIIEGSLVTLIRIYHDVGQWASFLNSRNLCFFVMKWKVRGGDKNYTLVKELLILHR